MRRLRRFVIAAVLGGFGGVGVILALSGGNSALSAPVCSTNWIGASGLWSNPANWDAGVPTSATSVCIVKNGNYTVTIDFAGAQAASIIVGDPANATPTQTLQVGTAPLPGSLSTYGSATSKLTPRGKIRVMNGSMSIDGGQTFAQSGGSLVVDTGQTFQVTGGDTYQWSSGINTGDPILINGGTVALSGSPTGALRHIGATYLTGNVPAGVSMTLEAAACSYGSDLSSTATPPTTAPSPSRM